MTATNSVIGRDYLAISVQQMPQICPAESLQTCFQYWPVLHCLQVPAHDIDITHQNATDYYWCDFWEGHMAFCINHHFSGLLGTEMEISTILQMMTVHSLVGPCICLHFKSAYRRKIMLQQQIVNSANLSKLVIIPEAGVVQWCISMFIDCIDVGLVLQELWNQRNRQATALC